VARLAGGDAEHDVRPAAQRFDRCTDAVEQRLVQGRIALHLDKRRAVTVRELASHGRAAVGRERAEGLGQRQPHDGERRRACGHRQPEPGKGVRHRLADAVLAVDERAVAIEDDELLHSGFS